MRSPTMTRRLLAAFLALVLSLTCVPEALAAESATAVTMQLMKTEGTVGITNASGRKVSLVKNMKLRSGYHVATEEESYSWINLDSAKLIKEDAVTEISIRKSGKKLEVLLDSGNLFFNVTEPLDEDESLNIRTSTMIVGIRGTSGWVKIIDQWTSELYILEGTVTVTVTDPVTGETKTDTVTSGGKVVCKVYPQDTSGDKCEIIRDTYTADGIDGFVLAELAQDQALREKVEAASGLELDGVDAAKRLKDDQTAVRQKLEQIKKQAAQQENNVSVEPVWTDPQPDKADTKPETTKKPSGSTGGGYIPAPTPSEIVTLTMPQEDDTVHDYLAKSTVKGVILVPGTASQTLSSTANLLEVDSGLTVPAGKSLTLQSGVGIDLLAGQTMQVSGTVTVNGAFTVRGTLTPAANSSIRAWSFALIAEVPGWKASDSADSQGFYSLVPAQAPVSHTITFNANGGTPAVSTAKTDENGRVTALPAVARTGYTFKGWFTAADGGTEVTTSTVFDRDATVYAQWTAAQTWDPSKHTYQIIRERVTWTEAKAACEALGGHLATITCAEEQSYIESLNTGNARLWIGARRDDSNNWTWVTGEPWEYTNWAPGQPDNSPNVVSNENCVVLWPKQWNDLNENNKSEQSGYICEWDRPSTVYTITFVHNNGSGLTSSAQTDAQGKLPVSAFPDLGVSWTFKGWYDAPTGGNAVTEETVFTKDTTVYAQWGEPRVFTITFNANGGTPAATSVETDSDGIAVFPADPTRTGYTFNGWFTAASGGEQVTAAQKFSANTTLYAQWTEDAPATFTITFNPNGGTVTPTSAATGTDGKLASLPTPTRTGYTFNGWYTAASGGTRVTENYVFAAAITVYAHWTANSSEPGTLDWTYDADTKTLRISGSGDMEDYTSKLNESSKWVTTAPWREYYSQIQAVEIDNGVTRIGASAFFGCYNIKTVSLPNGVTSIGNRAFYNCEKLTSVNIPNGVTTIDIEAFSGCRALPELTIPNSVTTIGERAFSQCLVLANLTIPNSVTAVGPYAFDYCSGFTEIEIPSSVDSISVGLFQNCINLERVSIPSSVTSIGSYTFSGCSKLTEVRIPSGVPSIGDSTFLNCSRLTSIEIPSSVTSIGKYALQGCSRLTSVTIPSNVTTIGSYAFSGCSSLTDAYYPGTEAQWNAITGIANADIPDTTTIHYNSTRSTLSMSSDAAPGYVDVPADAWYAEAVAYCRERGLMNGTSATEFSPDATLTRAMTVTVLHRLAGTPAAASTEAFADVEPGQWYTEAVSWADSQKIVQGYGNGLFGVNDPVTHEQVQLIFRRYSGDSTVQTIGMDTPSAPATRAEVAATLMQFGAGETLEPGKLSVFSAMDIMCGPSGIAADRDGSLLVTDLYHKQVWRVVSRDSESYAGGATVQDLYGQPVGGYNDAALDGSYFKSPWAIAPFLDGWAVTDTENNVVRLIRAGSVQTVNGVSSEKLTVTKLGVAFDRPTGLASDEDGNLYVADTFNGAIRKITPKGGVSTIAKNLSDPTGLAWKDGALYVAETGADRIVKVQDGKVSTVASGFDAPQGVTVGADGTVYVADTGNGAVKKISGGRVTTLAERDPGELNGGLTSPTGLLVQGGKLYICDPFARKVFVYQIG